MTNGAAFQEMVLDHKKSEIARNMLPAEIAERLVDFLMLHRTGELVLDIKDGRILGWKLTESGRIKATAA